MRQFVQPLLVLVLVMVIGLEAKDGQDSTNTTVTINNRIQAAAFLTL